MDSTTPNRGLYDEVRRLLLALLDREGVAGVVLLDRDGGLVVREGGALIGDVAGSALRFWKLGRAASGLGGADRAPNRFVRDRAAGAWSAPAGLGLTLMVFVADDACPGSIWRWAEPAAERLRDLVEGSDPEPSSVEPTGPRARPEE